MKLSKREKWLAILAGICVLIVGARAVWLLGSWAFGGRGQEIANLENQLAQKQILLNRVKQTAARMKDLRRRSLPRDPLKAENEYLHWLWELGEARFDEFKETSPPTIRPYQKDYQELSINLGAEGSLADLVGFLYEFYRAGHLHRIRRLTIKPAQESSALAFAFHIQALSLPGADRPDTLFDVAQLPESDRPQRLAHRDLRAYDPILQRALFRPYVMAPDLGGMLAGMLNRGVAEGARAAAPKPPPPEPPPKPEYRPPIDIAKHIYLTAIVHRNLVPQVWLHVRVTDDKPKLGEGEPFELGNRQLGTLRGKIVRIGQREVLVELADGRRLVVGHGQSFAEARELLAQGQ